MANKPFNIYFGERIDFAGSPPPAGLQYLVLNDDVVQKTTFGLTGGFASVVDDSVVTTIVTADTWTVIANTLNEEVITPNLVFAANAFTYVGENSIAPVQIRAAMSCKKTEPVEMAYKIALAINGAPTGVIASTSVGVVDTQRSFVSTVFYVALQQNDVVTMVVKNISGDHDLIITDAQLSIG
jgi:hypothetical protein